MNEPSPLVTMVQNEFAFLVERGFRPTIEGDNAVKYENELGVFVNVFHDPREEFVGYRVGLVKRPKDALTAAEVTRLAGVTSRPSRYAARSDQLRASVESIAYELRTYGERALAGDEAIFHEAMDLRREYTRHFKGER